MNKVTFKKLKSSINFHNTMPMTHEIFINGKLVALGGKNKHNRFFATKISDIKIETFLVDFRCNVLVNKNMKEMKAYILEMFSNIETNTLKDHGMDNENFDSHMMEKFKNFVS